MPEPSDLGVRSGSPLLGPVGYSARRPAASLPVATGLCASDRDRLLEARGSGWVAMLRLTKARGNHVGNPGADTSHHRTALDEMDPAPEQPGWVWAGPVGGLGTDW